MQGIKLTFEQNFVHPPNIHYLNRFLIHPNIDGLLSAADGQIAILLESGF